MSITRRNLIIQLMAEGEGSMDDVMQIVNQNSAEDDSEVAHDVTTIGETDDGICYLYFAGEEG